MIQLSLEQYQFPFTKTEHWGRMVDQMVGGIDQQIELWIKGELQDKFSSLNWEDKTTVAQTLKDSGYTVLLEGMGHYTLFLNDVPISKLQVQLNFGAGKK